MSAALLRWLVPLAAGVVVGVLYWIGYAIGTGPAVSPWGIGFVVFAVARAVNALGGLVVVRESAFPERK